MSPARFAASSLLRLVTVLFPWFACVISAVDVAAAPSAAWEARVRSLLAADLVPVSLVSASADGWAVGTADGVAVSDLPVAGHPAFDRARRVSVPRAFEQPWGANAHSPAIPVDVPEGRVLFVTLWMRCPVLQGGQSATVRVYLERSPEWEGLAETGATLDAEWRRIHLACVTTQAYAAGSVRISTHLGFGKQDVDLGPISILDLGSAAEVDVRTLPTNTINWPGMEADAPWRFEAERRIDELRRRDLELRLIDAAGTPVVGATIALTQLKRTASIGSFSGYRILDQDLDGTRLRDKFDILFDRITVPIYWADWGWLQKEEDYVALAEWAESRHPIDIRGHTLIYPGWRFLPSEMSRLKEDPEAFQAACLAQIRRVGERLRGVRFDEIDVTNELRTLTDVTDIIGREGVVEWFAEARRVFPGVKLCLNENTILTNGGRTGVEQENLLEWYHYLKARGQAPDVLGLQGHFSEGVTGAETIWRILDRFAAETEAELQITEFDLNTLNDRAHADYTRDFLTAVYAHPRVTGVTLWGFWEGDHWMPNAAIWRRDWSARPAAAVYEELLGRKWRTNLEVVSDESGVIRCRVFTGELQATVSLKEGRKVGLAFGVAPGEGTAVVTLRLP